VSPGISPYGVTTNGDMPLRAHYELRYALTGTFLRQAGTTNGEKFARANRESCLPSGRLAIPGRGANGAPSVGEMPYGGANGMGCGDSLLYDEV